MATNREQALLDRIAALEEVVGQDQDLSSRLRDLYGLERLHAQMLGMLYRRDFVTRDGLYTVLYEGRPEAEWPEEKILDVQICKMRRHLRKAGHALTIETKWGEGWRLHRDSRTKIARDLARKSGLDGLAVAPDAPPLAPAGAVMTHFKDGSPVPMIKADTRTGEVVARGYVGDIDFPTIALKPLERG